MKIGMPRNWRDWLALLILAGIGAMWVWVPLEPDIRGATIMLATLVVQFYFRRSSEQESSPTPPPHG